MSHLQPLPNITNAGPHNLERYFLEIRNRYKWLLDFGGQRVLLFKRKYAGARCPNYDQIRKRDGVHEQDNICFGTGFVGGYFKPIEIMCSLVSGGQEQALIQEAGRQRIQTIRPWTLWEPVLSNGDFIVLRSNKRMWITSTFPRTWKHYITRQDFEMNEVERNHPIYTIPI